nr:hypothetical protein HK105_006723 [Polyrhizophydium stewartii]
MLQTVVVKPAHQTPLSTLMLAHIVSQTSVPRGVLNVVLGGAEIGQHLAAHPGLDMVSFTGSTKVGRLIAAANAAVGPRRCTLELGGKNPIIVCADADLDKAADSVVNAAFGEKRVHGLVSKNLIVSGCR